jgi:hypothetical protein
MVDISIFTMVYKPGGAQPEGGFVYCLVGDFWHFPNGKSTMTGIFFLSKSEL